MIPAHALGLKEYVSGTHVSKMSDNIHTSASLCHSEELRVKYAPRHTIPEVIHLGQELSESLPTFDRERSWDVLPNKPARTNLAYCSNILVHESRLTLESFAFPRDGE